MTFPFRTLSADSFLTPIEQSILAEDGRAVYSPVEKKWTWGDTVKFHYNPADSLEIKRMDDQCNKNMERWMSMAIVSEFADIVSNNFISDPSFTDIHLKMSRHVEKVHYKIYDTRNSNLVQELILMVDSLTQCKKLSALAERKPLIFGDFETKLKSIDEHDYSDDFEYHLRMPGRVYSTNAFGRVSDQLNWTFGPMLFFMKDYKMKASSRAANPWIMVLTGIVAVMLIYILVSRRSLHA
jgi:hypothetical protein